MVITWDVNLSTIRSGLFLIFVSVNLYALNPIHDARYQFYPEIFEEDIGIAGFGTQTHFDGDYRIPLMLQFGLSKRFELGGRINISHPYGHMFENYFYQMDIGFKVKLSDHEALQTDLLFGINNEGGEGLAIGYTTARRYTKTLSALYETRLATLSGLVGNQIFMIEVGAYPYIQVSSMTLFKIGLVASTGLRSPIDVFSMDVIPGFEWNYIKYSSIMADFTMGVRGPHDNNYRLAIYVTQSF
jgi:hypothetical protein